jgi:hypothetical protein
MDGLRELLAQSLIYLAMLIVPDRSEHAYPALRRAIEALS